MKIIKFVTIYIFLMTLFLQGNGQNSTIIKLRSKLASVNSDSLRFRILDSLNIYYLFCSEKVDSSYYYSNESIKQAFPLNDKKPLILAYARMGSYFYYAAKYGAAIQILNKAISLSEQENFYGYASFIYLTIGEIYTFVDQQTKAKSSLKKAKEYLPFSEDPFIT